MYTEQFDQTGQTAVMEAAIHGNATSSGAMISQSYITPSSKMKKSSFTIGAEIATEEAIGRINAQIDAKQHKKLHVEPEEAVQILKSFASEKVVINHERLDMFFSSNKFFKQFRGQTDILAVHELYKALTLKQYTAGQTVIRYGTTSDECFFLIQGKVEKMMPVKTTYEAKYEDDLIKFYADNYDNIIWDKVEEGQEMKHIVDMYREDPGNLDLDRQKQPKIELVNDSFNNINLAIQDVAEDIVSQLSRPGSAISLRQRPQSNRSACRHLNTIQNRKRKSDHVVASKEGMNQIETTEDSIEVDSEATFAEEVWMFRNVADIEPSQSFGQAAIAQTKPSLVTYVCAEDCQIASLSKETCVRILEKAVKRDFQGRIQFLKSFRILSEMSQNQLESLLYHLKLMHLNRGQTIFSVGDKPEGIYLIQEGSFELTKPGNLHECQEKIVNAMKVDPMAKFQMRKQARVIKDSSRKMVKLAILGSGELFGLEECQMKPNQANGNLKTRNYTVKCLENNSKLVFLSHQVLAEKVLYDPRLEQQVKYDCALKEFFHNSRELQHQQTVWNGSLTSMRQIENAAEKAEDEFDEQLKKDTYGNMNLDMKGLPKLRTVDQYMRQKFEAQVLNTIMDRMQERAIESMANEEQGVRDFVKLRMKEIESHFDHNINVINADRREQKARKAHITAKKAKEKSKQELAQQSLTMEASRQPTFMDSRTQFQDSLLSSHGNIRNSPRDFDHSQNIPVSPHFNSMDQKMKIVHSLVKQRVPDSGYDELDSQDPHFMSADVDQVGYSAMIALPFNQSGSMPIAEPSEISLVQRSGVEGKGQSNFGFTSNVGETINAQVASIAINEIRTGKITPKEMLPPISGDRSDGAVFRGLNNSTEGSGGLGSQTQMDKIKTDNQQQDNERTLVGQATGGSKDPLNKTHENFQNKERNLLDMFKEQASDHEKSDENEKVEDDGVTEKHDDSNEASKATTKDGGIVVSHRSRQEFQGSSQLEQHKNSMPPGKEMQIHELRETTGQASHGPLSIIRDPIYNQDKIKMPIGLGKKLLGLSGTIKVPGGVEKHIKIPKVDLDTDIPVYAEEGEERETQGSPEQLAPVVNISTRLLSKKGSKELLEDSISTQEPAKLQPPNTAIIDVNFNPKPSEVIYTTPTPPLMEEKPVTIYKTSAMDTNELPYNQYVSQSGLKGKKRNQLSYISKTIGDKSFKSKMRATVASMKDQISAPSQAPIDQQLMHTTLNESFTANMPELYTGVVHSQTIDVASVGGYRGTRAVHSNSMFPNITPGMATTTYQRQRDHGFNNADISMMENSKLGPVQDVQRIVDNHQAINLKKQVFVPSQMNPRLKRKTGKSLAAVKLRKQSNVRGTSANSFGTYAGKSNVNDRHRSFSIGQKNSVQLGSISQKESMDGHQQPMQMMFSPLNATSMADQRSLLEETRNSFAKQMQNPDDTQYQTAIMREARQKQMLIEATRAASQSSQQTDHPLMEQSELERTFGGAVSPLNLSPAATAAASELIHKFLSQPNEPISSEAFLNVQKKYELPPFEAYQLLLQQIQFQKALLTPPTAASVIKVSHNNYTSAVRDKREEVISFRNDLFRRYTYKHKRQPSELMGHNEMAMAAAAIQVAASTTLPATAIKSTRRN